MSFRQNVNQQLRDAGYDDLADRIQLLLSDTIPSNRNAPLSITVNESIVDYPLSGYGSDEVAPTSEFRQNSDPLPDPGNFPPVHAYGTDRALTLTDGFNSDIGSYYSIPLQEHKVFGGKPGNQARYDVSSLQVSQYATRRAYDNDVRLEPPRSL